jgi:hypothetical protein
MFLNGVGMAVHGFTRTSTFVVSPRSASRIHSAGDVLFRLAGIQELENAIAITEKRFGQAN